MQLDATDLALIAALSENARMSVSTIARRIGLARTTVQARLERLEKSGVVEGYSIRLGRGARPAISGTLLICTDPHETAAILSRIKSLPEVKAVHSASGRYDLVIEVATDDTATLDRTLEWIGSSRGVKEIESLIHLATKLERRT